MFALRDRLPSRTRYWFGFAVCPVVTWLLLGCQLLLIYSYGRSFGAWIGTQPHAHFIVTFGMLLLCAFWGCVAVFSGFASAFF